MTTGEHDKGRLSEGLRTKTARAWRFAEEFAGIIEVTGTDAWLHSYERVVRFRRGKTERSE